MTDGFPVEGVVNASRRETVSLVFVVNKLFCYICGLYFVCYLLLVYMQRVYIAAVVNQVNLVLTRIHAVFAQAIHHFVKCLLN